MDLITFEHETFKALEHMFEQVCKESETLKGKNAGLQKEAWISKKRAAEYLGLGISTIEKYKHEIGYSQPTGYDQRFKISDLENWMMKSYCVQKPSHKLKLAHK